MVTLTMWTYAFANGETRTVKIDPANADEIEVIGLDEDGRIVVRYYRNGKSGGWTFGLTLCCNASDKGCEDGVFCRACYGSKPNADAGWYDPEVAVPLTSVKETA